MLEKYGVRVIGTSIESIKRAKTVTAFKQMMERTNQPMIKGEIVNTVEDAQDFYPTK